MGELIQNKKRYYLISGIIILIVVIDQISKYLVKSFIRLNDSYDILGSFFKLTYIENYGMAFGIQLGNRFLFTVLSILAVFIIIYYLIQSLKEQLLMSIALSLILGGAIGNLIDRIWNGRVVDFLDFEFFNINIPRFELLSLDFSGYQLDRWPIFNIADSAVTCGMIMITIIVFIMKDQRKQEIIK